MKVISLLFLSCTLFLTSCGTRYVEDLGPTRYEQIPYFTLRSAAPGLSVMVREGWGYFTITKVANGYIIIAPDEDLNVFMQYQKKQQRIYDHLMKTATIIIAPKPFEYYRLN